MTNSKTIVTSYSTYLFWPWDGGSNLYSFRNQETRITKIDF